MRFEQAERCDGAVLRLAGVRTVAAVLGARAVLGFTGRTEVVSPGSVSARFRRMDRRFYSPLCAALAVGAASSLPVRQQRCDHLGPERSVGSIVTRLTLPQSDAWR